MHIRTKARGWLAGVAAFTLLAVGTAQAAGDRTVEPLNQYAVSGRVTTDQLARAGLRPATRSRPSARPASSASWRRRPQAAGAARQGRDRSTALDAGSRGDGRAVRRRSPTADARLRRLPAVEPDAGSVPRHVLDAARQRSRSGTTTSRRATPTLVKEEDDRHSRSSARTDQGLQAHRRRALHARRLPAGHALRRPPSTHASGSPPRSTGASSVPGSSTSTGPTGDDQEAAARRTRSGSSRSMNPDGYDYTFTSAEGTRLWRKNLRDVNGDGVIDHDNDGVDHEPQLARRSGTTTSRAPLTTRRSETYHGAGPGLGARGPGRAQPRSGASSPSSSIDYHSFAQLILYPEGWQVETRGHRRTADEGAGRRRRQSGRRGLRPRRLGRALHHQRRRHGRRLRQLRHPGLHGRARRRYRRRTSAARSTGPDSFTPGGFVFQDDEAGSRRPSSRRTSHFALDLVKSAPDPTSPSSHLGNTAPEFVPTTFSISTATRRPSRSTRSGRSATCRVYWQVNGGRVHRGNLTPSTQGGDALRQARAPTTTSSAAQVTGTKAGRQRAGVVRARPSTTSDPFTYTVKSTTRQPGAAHGRRGLHGHELRRQRRPLSRAALPGRLPGRRSTPPASPTTSTTSTPTAAPRPPRSACSVALQGRDLGDGRGHLRA